MIFQSFQPRPPLDQYVRDNITLEPVKKFQHSWLSGMQEIFLTISSGSEVEMIVVSFLPGGRFPFLGMPVTELRNQVIETSVVLAGR